MSKKIMLGGLAIMLGLVTMAIGFVLGLGMIADAGYNSGSIEQMIQGGVILILFEVTGASIINEGIKLMQVSKKDASEQQGELK